MGHIRGEKIIKITAGCCLALLIAQALELRYSTSVVTITLLSILGTRRETFRIAGKRFCAFFAALAVALPSFYLLQYSVAAIAVYLLLFVALCQLLRIEEGLSMSTVLMLHFWSARTVALSAVFDEHRHRYGDSDEQLYAPADRRHPRRSAAHRGADAHAAGRAGPGSYPAVRTN